MHTLLLATKLHSSRPSPRRPSSRRAGLTILEVLIAIGVIGLLMAILIPAVSAAREASRRTQCESNLHQVGVAIQSYESAERAFPRMDFTFCLLPYIGHQNIHDLYKDVDSTEPFAELKPINPHVIPLYICPSDPVPTSYTDPDDPGWVVARTNYAGSIGTAWQRYGWNGFFNPDKRTLPRDFTKGLSTTTAVAEILCPLSDGALSRLRTTWNLGDDLEGPTQLDAFADRCEQLPREPTEFGYHGLSEHGVPWHGKVFYHCSFNHSLPPNRPSCMSGTHPKTWAYVSASMHSGGANVLFADGHVEFTSQFIDRHLWRELGSRLPLDQISIPD